MKNELLPWAERYLERIDVKQEAPTLAFLEKVCHAHLNAVPFENISKLLYMRDFEKNGFYIPPIDVFVENMFRYDYGGTCYTNNSHALTLLKELEFEGYHVELGSSHIGIIIELDGERWYADFGSASPFFKPVNFERDRDNVTAYDVEEIRIIPDPKQEGFYRFIRYRDGKVVKDDWDFKPDEHKEFEEFHETIEKSNKPGAFFLSHLRCHHYQVEQNRTLSLINNKLSIKQADGHVEEIVLKTPEEIEEVVVKEFNLPNLPVKAAIDVLGELGVDVFNRKNATTI